MNPSVQHRFFFGLLFLILILTSRQGWAQRKFIPSKPRCEIAEFFYLKPGETAYSMNPTTPNTVFPLPTLCFGAGTPHNLGWYRFQSTGGASRFWFTYDINSCRSGQGIQAGIFEGDCEGTLILDCTASADGKDFELAGLCRPNIDYFLWVDGLNGDVCEFELRVIGAPLAPEQDYGQVTSDYYHDQNQNCRPDMGERLIQKCQTTFESSAQPALYSVNLGSQGFAYLPFDDYLVHTDHEYLDLNFCPDSFSLTVDSMHLLSHLKIGGHTSSSCPLVSYNILPPTGRNRFRCDPNVSKKLIIDYYNIGFDGTRSDSAVLQLSPYMDLVTMDHPYTHVGGDTYHVALHDLLPNESASIEIEYFLICEAKDLGKDVCIQVKSLSTQCSILKGAPPEDHYCGPIQLSFDPNDIHVSPFGVTESKYIEKDQVLDYIIRFQNTGNDTAYNIIIDLHTGLFSPKSVIMGYASHNTVAKYSILPDDFIRFYLNDINLVDSTTHEAASHGYVKFKLKLENPIEYERIEHQAGIKFDYNVPIQTNTDFHTIAPDYFTRQKVIHLCSGEIYQEHVFYSDSSWADTIQLAGPDSLITTLIIVHDDYQIELDTTIERGDSIWGVPIDTDTFVQKLFGSQWGCDSLVIYKVKIKETTGRDEWDRWGLQIFPNPVTGHGFYIIHDGLDKGHLSLTLYSQDGRKITEKDLLRGSNHIDIPPEVKNGVLLVEIKTDVNSSSHFEKMILLR